MRGLTFLPRAIAELYVRPVIIMLPSAALLGHFWELLPFVQHTATAPIISGSLI